MMVPHESLVWVFALLVVLAALLIWRSLKKFNDAKNDYDFHDLLMEGGRASKAAHVMMGAFAATTWMFVYYTLLGKMTEGYFGLYAAAWIAPVVARLFSGSAASSGTTTTTTLGTVTTTTPEGK